MNPLSVLFSFPEGLAVFDSGFNTLFVNPVFSEILKISFPVPDRISARDLLRKTPDVAALLDQYREEGVRHLSHDILIATAEGRETPVDISIGPIDLGDGATGACIVLRSNVRKKELHSEFEKEEKIAILSMMAAGLAHEIKNPLGGIKLAAQLIGRQKEDPAQYCHLIVKETDRINALVAELLDPGKGREKRRVKVNIHRILDDVLDLQEPLLRRMKIETIRDYDPSLPTVKAHSDKLKQVFVNLVKNAAEVMKKNGTLRVKTRVSLDPEPSFAGKARKRMIAVEIIDSGKGLDPKVAKHLFTPFNTNKKKGTGLGLVISLKIVRDHGGRLTLENNPYGPGVTARALLPID